MRRMSKAEPPKIEFTSTVVVRHLPEQTDPAKGQYAFAYTVTIRNTGNVTGQLIARHWVITDANGHTDEVRGLAVVGHQPVLKPGEVFEYTSGTTCPRRTARCAAPSSASPTMRAPSTQSCPSSA